MNRGGDGANCDDPSWIIGNASSSQLGDAIAAGSSPVSSLMRFDTPESVRVFQMISPEQKIFHLITDCTA